MLACTAVMAWQRLENRSLSPLAFCKDWRSTGRIAVCAALVTLVAWTPIMLMTSLPSIGGALAARVSLPMIIILTARGRAISGCVLAVAYADIYGAPTIL